MFHKAGPDIEKAIGPVLVFIQETTNLLNLWIIDILRITAEQVSQPDMQIGFILGIGTFLRIL